MDGTLEGIVVADQRGIIQSFNRAAERLFGYSQAEAVGESIALLMPEPHRSAHPGYIGRYLETGDKHVIGVGRDVEALRKDGSRVPIYLAVTEFNSPRGPGFVAVLHDTSTEIEARNLRDRLARAERLGAVAEMAAAVAHEMNQPLAALAVYAQAARQLAVSSFPQSRQLVLALDNVIEQTRRAGRAVERVRRLFQGEKISLESADLNALMRETVELARADARPRGVTIEFHPGADIPAVQCDPVQIQQVLGNLIGNAVEAMLEIDCRNGRMIGVASMVVDSGVRGEVRDCGGGIDPAVADEIFEPFQSHKKDGLGVGLAISRTIILNHGGCLQCENIVDDGGTFGASFSFTLPV